MTGIGRHPEDADPDLAELPAPRRPFRRFTLLIMLLTAGFSFWLALGLRGEFAYTLQGGPPSDLGDLAELPTQKLPHNRWVRAAGALETEGVLRFRRPLDPSVRRLARVVGHPNLWVELQVPPEADGRHFVQPESFLGRLVPLSGASLRYGALADEIAVMSKPLASSDSILLIDGESPRGMRWALGIMLLLIGFTAFNLLGIVRLARPVRDA